jgi:hypothetical protein
MASIVFDATLDSSKLDAAIKQSNQTINQWSQDVEKAGGKADQSFSKLGTSLKDSIKDQKEYIKGLTKEIKDMEKAFADAVAGKDKKVAGGELAQAKRRLTQANGELIGMQNEQIAANTKEESTIGSLVGGIGKWIMGLVSVGAALKIAKGIIASTEESAHKFEVVVAQTSSGLGYFFKTIASGDWSNFTENLSKAIRGAKEFVDQMEIIQNKRNELNVKTAGLDIKIGEERAKSYDEDVKVVKESLTNIIRLQKEKFDLIADLSKKEYETNLDKAATDSGLSKDRIENFITEYSTLEKMLAIGKEYNEYSKLSSMGAMNKDYFKNLFGESGKMAKGAEEAGKYVEQISKVTPEARKIIADFRSKQLQDEAAFNLNNRRDKQRLVGIEKQEIADKKKAAEDTKKAAIENAKLENQIAKQKELLTTAVTAGNEKEMGEIAAKIVALENELAIREELTQQAIGNAIIREPPINKVGLPSISKFSNYKVSSVLSGAPRFYETAESRRILAKYNKEDQEVLAEQYELRRAITNEVFRLADGLKKTLNLDEENSAMLDDMMSALSSSSFQEYAVSIISTWISGVIDIFDTAGRKAEDYQSQLKAINIELQRNQDLINKTTTSGGADKLYADRMILLQRQLELAWGEVAQMKHEAPRGIPQEWIDAVTKDILYDEITAIEDLQEAWDNFKRGGLTSDTIADAIIQGLENGKAGINDFASYMNDMFRTAVLNSFKDSLLQSDQMKAYLPWLTKMMEGGITPEEAAENARHMAEIAADFKEKYDLITAGLDIAGGMNQGLSGGIRRELTEQTGTELAGLFRRFADDGRLTKDYTKIGVDRLVGIEANTLNTVLELQKTNLKLDTVITNTSTVYAKGLG